MRLPALQDCPAFSILAATAAAATPGTSSVSRTMKGSDPPSSRTTFLRCWPATAATAPPARSLPVTETPAMRGSAIIVATWSLEAKTLT